jgi:hypothetical protein
MDALTLRELCDECLRIEAALKDDKLGTADKLRLNQELKLVLAAMKKAAA